MVYKKEIITILYEMTFSYYNLDNYPPQIPECVGRLYPEFLQELIQELEYTLIGYITTAKFFDLMDF